MRAPPRLHLHGGCLRCFTLCPRGLRCVDVAAPSPPYFARTVIYMCSSGRQKHRLAETRPLSINATATTTEASTPPPSPFPRRAGGHREARAGYHQAGGHRHQLLTAAATGARLFPRRPAPGQPPGHSRRPPGVPGLWHDVRDAAHRAVRTPPTPHRQSSSRRRAPHLRTNPHIRQRSLRMRPQVCYSWLPHAAG